MFFHLLLAIGFGLTSSPAFAVDPIEIQSRSTAQQFKAVSVKVKTGPFGSAPASATVFVSGVLDGQCDGDQYTYSVSTISGEKNAFTILVTVLGTAVRETPQDSCSNTPVPVKFSFNLFALSFPKGPQNYSVVVAPVVGKPAGQVVARFQLVQSSFVENVE